MLINGAKEKRYPEVVKLWWLNSKMTSARRWVYSALDADSEEWKESFTWDKSQEL
jgi:hypothetical protein